MGYTMASGKDRFSSLSMARLSAVLQAAKELVTIRDVEKALAVDRNTAAKMLSRWQLQGWLKRVGRGIYAPIPLDASTNEQVLEDPFVLVPALFAPGYVGGWTAAGHWDMTEQIFRSIFVFTTRSFRVKDQIIQGVSFTLKRIPQSAIFGIKTYWSGQTKVPISDKARTIVDLLADPATGGGIRHVVDCLQSYFKNPEGDRESLIRYAETLGNGAVFKRLGFLASRIAGNEVLVQSCRQRLTQGNSKLDPTLPCPRLVKVWRLWIPKNWEETKRD
jgi:predicted transcriptional regulator of viral defense system